MDYLRTEMLLTLRKFLVPRRAVIHRWRLQHDSGYWIACYVRRYAKRFLRALKWKLESHD